MRLLSFGWMRRLFLSFFLSFFLPFSLSLSELSAPAGVLLLWDLFGRVRAGAGRVQ